MQVINTWIIDGKDILFECVKGKWYLQKEVLQNEYQTVIIEVTSEKAKSLISK